MTVVLGLSARIGTLPVARSVIHGTSSRCTVRGTVLCCGIRASFSTAHAYSRLQTDSMHKNNIMLGVQTNRRHFLLAIDLPARHHSAVSTNLWRRGSSLHKGNLGEGKGGEGEGVGCSNEMKTKNINR